MLRRRLVAGTVLSLALLGGVTACGDSDSDGTDTPTMGATSAAPTTDSTTGGDTPAAGQVIEVTIKDGAVTPNGERVEVKAGEPITFEITSDTDEEMHVHSSPEHEFEIAPGSQTETFTIDRPGIVEVELHHLGVTVVQLEVS